MLNFAEPFTMTSTHKVRADVCSVIMKPNEQPWTGRWRGAASRDRGCIRAKVADVMMELSHLIIGRPPSAHLMLSWPDRWNGWDWQGLLSAVRLQLSNTFYESSGQWWFSVDSVSLLYNASEEAVFNASEVYAPASSSYHCLHVSSLQRHSALLRPVTDHARRWAVTFTDFQVTSPSPRRHYHHHQRNHSSESLLQKLNDKWSFSNCHSFLCNYTHTPSKSKTIRTKVWRNA